MRLRFKPRFFIITGSLLVGVVLFASNIMLTKKVEIKLVDSARGGKVLAATDNTTSAKSSYDLVEPDGASAQGGSSQESLAQGDMAPSPTGSITDYQPVTISYTVKSGDTVYTIAEKYHADPQTIIDYPYNDIGDDLNVRPGQILIIPNGYVDDTAKPLPPPIANGSGQFAWPAHGVITQYAYFWHPGAIDIGIPLRTEVRAADDGTVVKVEHLTTGYGIHVIISHGGGLTSLYAHLTEAKVVVGQGISKGDLVGLSGSTGRSTGPHLHFEVRRNGQPVDPMTLLPAQQ